MIRFTSSLVVFMLASGSALADRDQPRTTQWLALQRGGEAASRVSVQAANEIEREKAVDRFLKTYDYPIPPSFYGTGFSVKP